MHKSDYKTKLDSASALGTSKLEGCQSRAWGLGELGLTLTPAIYPVCAEI